jgi:hypothetical protein
MPKENLEVLEHDFPGVSKEPRMTARIVPVKIRKAIGPCLSHSPENRPSIREVVGELDKLFGDFTGDYLNPDEEKRGQMDMLGLEQVPSRRSFWEGHQPARKGESGIGQFCGV